MINIFLSICFFNYIPKEFQQLKRKALRTSQLKLLSDEKPEPIISPEKPYVTDSFIGTVHHPIFAITTNELKGYAISKTKEHIAIIADRETESGRSILEEKSVFYGENNIAFSLFKKIADDGEVAIYNISQIDPLAAFYNFDMKLSEFSAGCGVSLGNSFGARCHASWSESWEDNHPKEIELKNVSQKIKEKIKIYAGFKVSGEASAIVEKRGASLQAKFDGSLQVLAGAGFHIDQTNYSLPRQPLFSESIPFGSGTVTILKIPIKLEVKFVSSLVAEDVSFIIPHDITISRQVSINLHKGYTISTKHGVSPEYQKEIKIGTIQTNSKEKGDNLEEESFQAQFDGKFSIKAGIKVELTVGSSIDFSAEVGPEVGLELQMGLDSKKCTFPGLYGSFTPFVNAYCIFTGSLKIAGIQLIKFVQPITHEIYKKNLFNGCFFDGASSKELEKEYIQVERSRSIIQVSNEKIVNKSNILLPYQQPIFYIGNLDNDEKPIYLGVTNIFFNDDNEILNPNDYIIIPESKNITGLSLLILSSNFIHTNDVDDDSEIPVPYPITDKTSIKNQAIMLDLIAKKSNIVTMGNQFNIQDVNSYMNFQTKFISGAIKQQPISIILHTTSDGYFTNPNKYSIVDEINGADAENINQWVKIEVVQVEGKGSIGFYFYRYLEMHDIFVLSGLNGYEFDGNNKPMKQNFADNHIYIKLKPDSSSNDVLVMISLVNLTQGFTLLGTLNLTDEDISTVEPFVKEIGSYKITLKCNQNIDNIEYITKLQNIVINNASKDSLKGVIVRTFAPRNNYKPSIYDGSTISCDFEMSENERYGNLQFYINDPGYNIESNNNVFAFLKLPNILPLLTNAKNVDEKSELYVIKLEIDKSVYKLNDIYILNIPFRRRDISKSSINAILYNVYQSYDISSNERNDFDPFCPAFPTFSLKQLSNFFVGCVHTYLNPSDFTENNWLHYPNDVDYKFEDLPKENDRENGMPFSLLHVIKVQNPLMKASEPIKVFAKQNYFNFPDQSRLMIIDNETIENLNKYAPGKKIEVKCQRCGKIHIEKYPDGRALTKNGDMFAMYLTYIKKEFALEAVCNSEDDKFCTFDYDLSNDGVTLLEYNTGSSDDRFDPLSKIILSENEDDSGKDEFPGVEEIYDIETDTKEKANYRLNINCRRQIIPERKDNIYLTKPWKGIIKKIATHIENRSLTINVAQKESKGYTKIFMYEPELKSIPFNPNFLAKDDENEITNDLSQLGIKKNGKTIKQMTDDKDLLVDNNGHILIRNDYFDENKFKESINNNNIDLIGIPTGKYSLKHVKCKITDKKKKCNSGTQHIKDEHYDDETCDQPMVNFEVKIAYIGSSKIFENNFVYNLMKNARKILGHLIPSPNIMHTGIWVGPSDASDNSLGTILAYGNYIPNGNDTTYISKDGARAYTISLGEFKEMFEISELKKLVPQRNISLFNLIDEIKTNGKWTAKNYNWASNNCNHFTATCLNLLKAKRLKPDDNDWIIFPKSLINALEKNEK